MNILMVAAEMSPLVKVGGLADVTGALPAALTQRGHAVRVVLPLYGHLDRDALGLQPGPVHGPIPVRVGQRQLGVKFWNWPGAPTGVTVDLVECEPVFGKSGVYADDEGRGFSDSVERASLLAQAALILPELLDWPVDVLHAHDVQAALAPVYRRRWYAGRGLPGPAGTLLTIHNLAHQEIHGAEWLTKASLPEALADFPGPFEFFGYMNLLKGAIVESDLINTVSPTYAHEVVTDPAVGCGLEGVLATRGDAFNGILNGVDYGTWDPQVDPFLETHYGPDDLAGKARCRHQLLSDVGLEDSGRPVLGMVGRLFPQKGLDLVTPILDRLVAGGFSLVVLGTGDKTIEADLAAAAKQHPGRVAFLAEFNEARAHAIYAGSDLFLMPSLFEPCGLSQLYALRYGTPPVVRATGGLADTVVDISEDRGTGFVFADATSEALWSALEEARQVFAEPQRWQALQQRAMACDFGWDLAAAGYESLYQRLLNDAKNEER